MSNKTAVIGLGNTLRRDDGIGVIVLESLLKFYKKEGIDYLNFGTASFDLIHRMRDYDVVFLIDAINAYSPCNTGGLPVTASGGTPPTARVGEVRFFELKDAEYNVKEFLSSTHELNLERLFELYRKFELKTKVYVAGIEVEDISWQEGLSQILESKKKEIVNKINSFINNYIL